MADIIRRNILLGSAGLSLLACQTSPSTAAPQATYSSPLLIDLDRSPDDEIDLWPEEAPGAENVTVEEKYVSRDNPFGLKDRAAHNVTQPTLTFFKAEKPNGSTILIIPGGGYKWVVVEKEGFEGARYFNTLGYDVYVLKYRLPHQGWKASSDTPLQDAQRAVRKIRSLRNNDSKVIVMGFSAGGHLAGSLCQRFDAPVYDAVDAADSLSARPDLGILVYPVALMRAPHAHEGSRINLIGDGTDVQFAKYDLTTAPNPEGPPIFMLHALDDEAVPVENSLTLVAAYRKAGVPAVIHTFEKGGHGFGLRGIDDLPVHIWPKLVDDWIQAKLG